VGLNESAVIHVSPCEVTAGELTLTTFPREDADKRVFEELVAAHEQMVLRTAYRLLGQLADAQDAAQEVFLRLFRNRASINGDPKGWLYRVTVNVCNDHHRRRKREFELDEQSSDPAPNPEHQMTLDERKQLLMQGLTHLSPREREAVVLRDIEGLTTAEVAGILGVEEVTIRSHVSTARVKLAKYVRNVK
jgi:RNA polymerase sigma-70 factor (ECF subfamily)